MTTDELLHISRLLHHSLQGQLSKEEEAALKTWYNESPTNQRLFDRCHDEGVLVEALAAATPIDRATIWNKISTEVHFRQEPALYRFLNFRNIAAAAILFTLAGATWYVVRSRSSPLKIQEISNISSRNDLAPGGNKATLTLSDGSTIVLDSAHQGLLAKQGGSQVLKTAGGLVTYHKDKDGAAAVVGFNMIATPRGGEYQVVLPDGTKAWLNAGSSLRFPTSFTGDSRLVEMTGEAYFEVARDKARPFRVKAGAAEVTVLGTSFDLMAYTDEKQIRTTLLEGAVRVNKGNQAVTLRPGQQARIDDQLQVITDANMEEAISWKNGLFEFNSADIETVMRTIARWYDVEIRYEAKKDSHTFTGQISKNSKASETLQILTTSGYHFTIEGKTITVLP